MSVQDEPHYGAANNDGEIYSPVTEDGFDPQAQSGRRAMLLLAGAFGGLLLLALILLKVYSPGTRGSGDTPRILADTSPYKSAPEDPGGEQIPNQDKTVYDVISGENRSDGVNIVPDSEDPVSVTPNPGQATIIVKKPDGTVPQIAPQTPVVKPVPKPAPAQPKSVSQVYTGNSNYVVQVASLRSAGEANDGWNTLNKKHGEIIPSALYADIKRVELDGKGIFHRLRVAGFADKSAANKFCERLKTRQQNCFVVTK